MLNKILVPLDGSEATEGILPYVSALAKGLDIPLVLGSVIDPEAVETAHEAPASGTRRESDVAMTVQSGRRGETQGAGGDSGAPLLTQMVESATGEAESALRVVAKRLADQGVKAEVAASFGPTAEQIVEIAERAGCDLIAMSTHGRGALGRGVLDSVTDKVVHSAGMPVLTITPDRAKMYWQDGVTISKIMVPLDGSKLAESVLPYVEALAKALSLEVILARVVKVNELYGATYMASMYTGYGKLEAEVEASAIGYLKSVAEPLEAKGLDVHWKLLKGGYATALIELANETPQDIIAMTSHGRSGLTRWVLGSVTESVIRASGDPVLVIPPQAVS